MSNVRYGSAKILLITIKNNNRMMKIRWWRQTVCLWNTMDTNGKDYNWLQSGLLKYKSYTKILRRHDISLFIMGTTGSIDSRLCEVEKLSNHQKHMHVWFPSFLMLDSASKCAHMRMRLEINLPPSHSLRGSLRTDISGLIIPGYPKLLEKLYTKKVFWQAAILLQ